MYKTIYFIWFSEETWIGLLKYSKLILSFRKHFDELLQEVAEFFVPSCVPAIKYLEICLEFSERKYKTKHRLNRMIKHNFLAQKKSPHK